MVRLQNSRNIVYLCAKVIFIEDTTKQLYMILLKR